MNAMPTVSYTVLDAGHTNKSHIVILCWTTFVKTRNGAVSSSCSLRMEADDGSEE